MSYRNKRPLILNTESPITHKKKPSNTPKSGIPTHIRIIDPETEQMRVVKIHMDDEMRQMYHESSPEQRQRILYSLDNFLSGGKLYAGTPKKRPGALSLNLSSIPSLLDSPERSIPTHDVIALHDIKKSKKKPPYAQPTLSERRGYTMISPNPSQQQKYIMTHNDYPLLHPPRSVVVDATEKRYLEGGKRKSSKKYISIYK